MKMLLTHSYFYQLDTKQWKNKTPYPPLATITALAYLEENGFDSHFYDPALDVNAQKCIAEVEKTSPELVIIYEDGFNYLTKMCLTNMRDACFEIIQKAKSIGAKVIVSSSDSTDHSELYHQNGADFVIHGEAENTLIELLKALELKGLSIDEIHGLSFIRDNKFNKTPPRSNLRDLDLYPMAKWNVIDLEQYRDIWKQSKFPFTLNITTTRGCPFKCNWCAKPIYGNRYNSRSPESVVKEIEHLIEKYEVDHFWITDDIFGLKPGWVNEFNALVQTKNLKFKYKIQSRADLLLKDETIKELAESGLEEAWLGAESGSQKILDAMDKGTTIEQIELSTKMLHERNVRVAYFLQFGYTGETKDDIEKTIKMVKENDPDDIGISVSYPLPGTVFYDRVKSQLGDKQNWTDSDDLDLMFTGTYSSDYYKKLQRYVHHSFRTRQGLKKWKRPALQISWRYVLLVPYNAIVSLYLRLKLN